LLIRETLAVETSEVVADSGISSDGNFRNLHRVDGMLGPRRTHALRQIRKITTSKKTMETLSLQNLR
jgi:hypothetical protein